MADADRSARRRLLAILAVAAALRLAVALLSIGTNDVRLWQQFGREACEGSFYELWARDSWVNHPPLPIAFARTCYGIAGENGYAFSLLIKLPGLLADVVATALIWRIVRTRRGARPAAVAASLYAIDPLAIALVGYHGNLDPLLATLGLVTWHLADRGRPARASAALGAAINVKLAPGPSAGLLLATARNWREARSVVVPLAIAAIPFAWMLAVAGRPFFDGVIGYRPVPSAWFAIATPFLQGWPMLAALATWLTLMHAATIVPVTLLWTAVLALRYRRRGGDVLTLGALFWCGLLAWTGGVVQYAIWPLPLLAAVRPRLAFAYGVASAVWVIARYASAWTGTFPPESVFLGEQSTPLAMLGALRLPFLIAAVVSLWRSQAPYREIEPTAGER